VRLCFPLLLPKLALVHAFGTTGAASSHDRSSGRPARRSSHPPSCRERGICPFDTVAPVVPHVVATCVAMCELARERCPAVVPFGLVK
jgi:hypothetical protein